MVRVYIYRLEERPLSGRSQEHTIQAHRTGRAHFYYARGHGEISATSSPKC